MKDRTYHVIKDPVHGTMQFRSDEDRWIKPIINHPLFQRLRHIKQLGLSDFVFPGAMHTRFNHSLGCCYIALQIANKLQLSDEQRHTVGLSALLHDVGHGPFSHTLEQLFQDSVIRHEEWTPMFLQAIGKRYGFAEQLFQDMQDIIMHRQTEQSLLADIVSSQLDADRFDYLLRDSHFCGVKYGEYDFRWLLHCLTIISHDGQQRLGITHKGIGVVEQYLNARRLMMRNIYFHAKKVAMELLLIRFLKRYAKRFLQDKIANQQASPLLIFLQRVLEFNSNPSEVGKKAFIENNFANYSVLTDFDVYALLREVATSREQDNCVKIAQRLYFRHMPKVIPLNYKQYLKMSAIIEDLGIADWRLFMFHLPHQAYQGETDPILVQCNDEIRPLGDVSVMINALSDRVEDYYYLCVDAELLTQQPVQQALKQLGKEV